MRSRLLTRVLDGLLTSEPRQRVRLAQSALASLLMAACIVWLHLLAAVGLSDGRGLWAFTVFASAGLLVVFMLIRCGWSRRLADPSMTLPQMLYAIACNAAGYMIAGRAHGAVPLILAVILMFGMFGMTDRQVRFVGLYALALFGGAAAWMAMREPAIYPPAHELAYFMMTAVVVCGVLVLNTRMTTMRDRLRRQREDLARALDRIQQLATHDELTGLVNRRRMQELLDHERDRSARPGHTWCVALIDVDHFKSVNDHYGHAIGDQALRALAQLGRAQIRKADMLARWGGEEFVLLLPDTGLAAACQVVDRWRRRQGDAPLQADEDVLHVRFSAGVAQHLDGESVEQTIARADAALYRAKALGRDRVVADPAGTDAAPAAANG